MEKKDRLRDLAPSNIIRMEEGLVRPRVENRPDPWVDWVSGHRRRKQRESGVDACSLPGLWSSSLCGGVGSH